MSDHLVRSVDLVDGNATFIFKVVDGRVMMFVSAEFTSPTAYYLNRQDAKLIGKQLLWHARAAESYHE